MPHEQTATAHRLGELRLRAVWIIWFAVLGVILARGLISPQENNCFREHYQPAGLNWLHGEDLYRATADTCRYSPLVHAFLVPFSVLSERWGATAWRFVEGLAFLAALGWWLKSVCPASLHCKGRASILLLSIPLAIGSLNNGQSNVFMMAGILAGMAAVSERRWTTAAFVIAFACFFKVYPLALALLLIGMYPRQFGWRFLLAVGAGVVLPFMLQDSAYVARQYVRWFGNLEADDRSQWLLSECYRDVWMLIRITGMPISHSAYSVIQVAAGCALGLLCLGMRVRGDGGRELHNRVLGLGCCWMTAFGPATESSTYILLSPTLAWLLSQSWRGELPRWTRPPLTLSAALFFTTVIAVATSFGRAVLSLGTQPVGALLVLVTLLVMIVMHPAREHESGRATPPLRLQEARGKAA